MDKQQITLQSKNGTAGVIPFWSILNGQALEIIRLLGVGLLWPSGNTMFSSCFVQTVFEGV